MYVCICTAKYSFIGTRSSEIKKDLEIVVYNLVWVSETFSQNVKILGEISNLVFDNVKSRVGMRNVKSRVECQGTRSPDFF